MRRLLKDLVGYGLASLAALAGDVGLLALLVKVAHLNYVAAATCSFLFGATIAYALSVRLAFHQHTLTNRRTEFFCFVALGVVGLVVNDLVMILAVEHLAFGVLAAKGAATGITFACNFVLRRQLLFVRPAQIKETRDVFD